MAEEQTNTIIRHLAYYSEENPNHPTTYDIGTDANKVTYGNTDLETYLNNLGPGGGSTPSYNFEHPGSILISGSSNNIEESAKTITNITTLQAAIGNQNSGLVKDVNTLQNTVESLNNTINNNNERINNNQNNINKISFTPSEQNNDTSFDITSKFFIKVTSKTPTIIQFGCHEFDDRQIGHVWTFTIKDKQGNITKTQSTGGIAFGTTKGQAPNTIITLSSPETSVWDSGYTIEVTMTIVGSPYSIKNGNAYTNSITKSFTNTQLDTISWFSLIHRLDQESPRTKNSITNTSLLDLIYPIGSIYINVKNLNPSRLFGGEWKRINGRFLLSAYYGDYDKSIPTSTDYNKQYNLKDEGGSVYLGKHSHKFTYATRPIKVGTGTQYKGMERNPKNAEGSSLTYQDTAETGYGDSLSNMPPYYVVNIWERTG